MRRERWRNGLSRLLARLHPFADRIALAFDRRLEHLAQARAPNPVRGVRDRWVEAARFLVLAARAGLERLNAARDAVFDAVIIANVEVQERALARRAPIASP